MSSHDDHTLVTLEHPLVEGPETLDAGEIVRFVAIILTGIEHVFDIWAGIGVAMLGHTGEG